MNLLLYLWKMRQKDQISTQQFLNQQRISPPEIRIDSPDFNDSTDLNLPPMLEPELPCDGDFGDSDEFSSSHEMLPGRFAFGDEYGPPQLEPQVPIPATMQSQCQMTQFSATSKPISPPSLTSPSAKVNESNEMEQPLPIQQPILTPALILDASSTKFTFPAPVFSSSSILNINGKRERSSSVDSSPDAMSKMPKLVAMVEEQQPVQEEKSDEVEEETTKPTTSEEISSTNENVEEIENTAPPALDSLMPTISEESVEDASEPTVHTPVEMSDEKPEPEERPHSSDELLISVEHHNVSAASSSGVSSMDSSMLAEEPIILRIRRSVDEIRRSVDEKCESPEPESSPAPSPLMPMQNTKLRPRQQPSKSKKSSSKQTKSHRRSQSKISARQRQSFVRHSKRSNHKQKRLEIQSNWRPVDEGQVMDVRINHQTRRLRCYNAIRHYREYDEVVRVRDCVKVRSSEGLENIGKVIRIFLEEPSNSIGVQVLWYYTQAQADIELHEKELLASKHCDIISADAIEEHAFVLTYSEYCRFVAETRLDELPPERRPLESKELISRGDENYGRRLRLPHEDSPIDLVYWCSRTFSLKTRKIMSATSSRRGSRGNRPKRSHR